MCRKMGASMIDSSGCRPLPDRRQRCVVRDHGKPVEFAARFSAVSVDSVVGVKLNISLAALRVETGSAVLLCGGWNTMAS